MGPAQYVGGGTDVARSFTMVGLASDDALCGEHYCGYSGIQTTASIDSVLLGVASLQSKPHEGKPFERGTGVAQPSQAPTTVVFQYVCQKSLVSISSGITTENFQEDQRPSAEEEDTPILSAPS